MSTVPTARGSVPAAELGVTLMHEHIFVLSSELQQNYHLDWDEEERVADAVARLQAAYQRGVRTVVDVTALGQGRYIPRIARIAAQSPVNILVATGVYAYREMPPYFFYQGPGTLFGGPDPMTELFVRDITEGIGDTGVRAAVIKAAHEDAELSPATEEILRASAQAHAETGAPITTHTNSVIGNGGQVLDLLVAEGVDPEKVIIGHSGDTDNVDYLLGLVDKGCYLGMDRFGMDPIASLEQRIAIVAEMVRRGHADRMVLSHDTCCFIDYLAPDRRPELFPRWEYTHIHDDVIPALQRLGVTDQDVHTMLVDNPRRIFAGASTRQRKPAAALAAAQTDTAARGQQ
ncbi:phosphotriesterase family protein [Actinoalloteichus hymeniacidonis]|uniref:Metal-dependent hydrolase with the TIM-barrel fold n=1 Tax=Actinoalloteichus hymeniacidonis TaxID=340345 RepID=A0AAC9HUH2_9PSEU|nr:phosphotriesterase [Actinoalloteichus hymeniacidonis]AOS64745.1 putative metal-dependent hydrolase with the TIM-barrel fold [Actinoalloteichus hymeniacidonis]MBB5907179.1 phosphotriesterase-related protein [Actinoalloteichus hymeniacidonis]